MNIVKVEWFYERFNVDIMKLYISARNYARKLKLYSSAIYKRNFLISLRLSDSVQRWKGLYFLALVLYLSSALILSSYSLLSFINKIDE